MEINKRKEKIFQRVVEIFYTEPASKHPQKIGLYCKTMNELEFAMYMYRQIERLDEIINEYDNL